MKKLNAVFEVDNDLSEYKLVNTLEGLGAKHITILPDTEHLKDDEYFKKLYKSKQQANKNLYKYIDSKR